MSHRRTFTILAAAAVVAVAIGSVALLTRDDDKGGQQISAATESGGSNTSTTTNTTPVSVIPSGSTPIWPFESMNRTFSTPGDAAKSFAVDYLGMTHARVGQTLDASNDRSDVEIFPNDRGNARTLVQVENRGALGWVVLGAKADEIVVDTPKPHDSLTVPLSLSGRSVAFEAQVGVELRAFGAMTSFAQGSVMGGSTDVQPFQGQIDVPNASLASDKAVLILFEGDASGEQTYTKATVIPLDGPQRPATFIGQAVNGDLTLLDFAGHVQRPATAQDKAALENAASLPSGINGTLPTLRGRFGTVAFFDGTRIASYNPSNGNVVPVVPLFTPAAKPISLDADESGRHLLWVDENHDLWTWSGGDAVKVGTGFNSAAW